MEERELKECPFCGRSVLQVTHFEVTTRSVSHLEYAIMCSNCGAFGPNDISVTRAEEMWNLRRPMDKILAAYKATLDQEKYLGDVIKMLHGPAKGNLMEELPEFSTQRDIDPEWQTE